MCVSVCRKLIRIGVWMYDGYECLCGIISCVCEYISINMYVYTYVYTWVYTRVYACVYMHMCYVRTYIVCIYISAYIYINICWYLFKYACMLVYVYTRIYVCICMYVGVHVCVGVLGWVLSVYLYLFVCSLAFCSVWDSFGVIRVRVLSAAGDPDPIQIRARCGPDA